VAHYPTLRPCLNGQDRPGCNLLTEGEEGNKVEEKERRNGEVRRKTKRLFISLHVESARMFEILVTSRVILICRVCGLHSNM
jgi:hypothetical protein